MKKKINDVVHTIGLIIRGFHYKSISKDFAYSHSEKVIKELAWYAFFKGLLWGMIVMAIGFYVRDYLRTIVW